MADIKHTVKDLRFTPMVDLKKICSKYAVPYTGLTRKQLIENILAHEAGKPPMHKSGQRTHREDVVAMHRISAQMRRFCYEYANCRVKRTNAQWGHLYGVSDHTITKWLGWHDMKALILKFQEDHELRMRQLFEQNEEAVVEQLLSIATSKRPTELKRRAISDFLGFAGRRNANTLRVMVKQDQSQTSTAAAAASVTNMTEDEMRKELQELEDFVGEKGTDPEVSE